MKKQQSAKPDTVLDIKTEADCQLFVKYKPEALEEEVEREMIDKRKEEKLRQSRRFDFWELIFPWRRGKRLRADKAET